MKKFSIAQRFFLQFKYVLRAFMLLPVTFFKKAVFGPDLYWRQYFWNKWGFLPKELLKISKRGKIIWIDALGGGEVTQSSNFIKLIKSRLPGYHIILSTNNPDSFKFAKGISGIDYVFDTPWDIPFVLRRAFNQINPSILVVIDQVRFPLIIFEAKKRGIKTVLVSAALANNYYLSEGMERAMFFEFYRYFDKIGAVNQEAVDNYLKIGSSPSVVSLAGDMKFDLERNAGFEAKREVIKNELALSPEDFILVAGSIHPREEEIVLEAYARVRKFFPALKLVLAPRYAKHLRSMGQKIASLGLGYLLRSRANRERNSDGKVILLDTFGELNIFYSLASMIIIGNSIFPHDKFGLGQNIAEPLLYQKPVFFGKYMNKWRQITGILKTAWPGFEIENAQQLFDGIRFIKDNPEIIRNFEDKCRQIIGLHKDAAEKNFSLIAGLLTKG